MKGVIMMLKSLGINIDPVEIEGWIVTLRAEVPKMVDFTREKITSIDSRLATIESRLTTMEKSCQMNLTKPSTDQPQKLQ